MILNAVFSWVAGILGWLLGQIPSWSGLGLPDVSAYGAAIADSRIWQYFGWANHFVPLDVALILLAAQIAIWAVLYGIEFLSWALTKLHILGGSSD